MGVFRASPVRVFRAEGVSLPSMKLSRNRTIFVEVVGAAYRLEKPFIFGESGRDCRPAQGLTLRVDGLGYGLLPLPGKRSGRVACRCIALSAER